MKKLAASIMLLFYFVVSTGFVVSAHYCMNKVASVQLGVGNSDACAKCGMHLEGNDGCCKNDITVVQMQADQCMAKQIVADFSMDALAVAYSDGYHFSSSFAQAPNYPLAHRPPIPGPAIYLLHRVFRL